MARPVSYLLKDVSLVSRRWLSDQAAEQDVSVADVIRSVLCERYGLVCPPKSHGYDGTRDKGAVTILLRLHPKLAKALEREQAKTGRTKRQIILDAIKVNREGDAS